MVDYDLRVIPTLTHHSDLVSDIPSGRVYIYIWHICNIYIIIYRYSDVPADILSGISDILSDVLSMSSWAIWRRNPLHQLAVEDEKEEEEVEEKELHLSEKYITDPHLAGELPEGSPTSQLLRYGIV